MAWIQDVLNRAFNPDSNTIKVEVVGGGGGGTGEMRFWIETRNPTSADGQPGDVWLNSDSGDLFKNENGTWNLKGNLMGPQGPQGEQGPQGPPGADGEDGRGVNNIVYDSDANELLFMMTDDTVIRLPWPTPKE
mgnify:CR=1 FL=1